MKEDFDCRKIIVIGNQIRRLFDGAFSKVGLTNAQGSTLCFIYTAGRYRDVFQRDVEDEFDLRRSSVTSVLQGLERGGYLHRESVSEDARLKKLVLTDKAIELYERISSLMDETNATIVRGMSNADMSALDRLMSKVKANLP
ncbi:MAG: MarR family transcriptional regulator [Treponema sp.]|jgi:DNA-binding MarR family transcriptional regulator|nr:MarR family transcriptional regulator [Treponema sp.]